jgi:transcriptional regulator with XRE-family HTH domain
MPRDEIAHQTPGQVFARRVREAREDNGWTQHDLADRLGIDRTTVVRIEAGGSRSELASLRDIFRFAAALDVAPIHLLTPLEDEAPVEIAGRVLTARVARAWIRGRRLLKGTDKRRFARQMPDNELRALVEAALGPKRGEEVAYFLVFDKDEHERQVRALMNAIRENLDSEEETNG